LHVSREFEHGFRQSIHADETLLAEDQEEEEARQPLDDADEHMDGGLEDPINGGDNNAQEPGHGHNGPLTEEQEREALGLAEQAAAQAQEDGVRSASEDIDNELRESVGADNEEPEPDISIHQERVSLSTYVKHYERKLIRDTLPERLRGVAAEILSGYTNSTKSTQFHINSFKKDSIGPQDCRYTVDVDSIMASFQPTDPFPFLQTANVQLYPIGRFDRRIVGTSKFTLCPSDEEGVNNLSWDDRV
jgi:hypothetical protein